MSTRTLLLLTLVSFFGAAVFGMYPVIVAHANDHAAPGSFLATSGGLLLLFGVGSIVGPLFAGGVMTGIGPRGLFLTSLLAHVALAGYATLRVSRREGPAAAAKGSFRAAPFAGTSTPETIALSPDVEATAAPAG